MAAASEPDPLLARVLLLVGSVALLGNLWLAGSLVADPHKNDFGRMYYSAVWWWDGHDMYARTPAVPSRPVEGHEVDLWNLNPPHFHLVLLPLARLPINAALGVWAILNGLCLGAALRWIIGEVHLDPTPETGIGALLCLLGSAAMSAVIVTGQLSFLLLVPVTLAWRAARHEHWPAAGAWLGLALSIKPFLLLFVPYLLLRRRWRALGAMAAVVAACFAGGLLVFGVANHVSWCEKLQVADGWSWLPMNASLLGMLDRTFTSNLVFTPLLDLSPGVVRLAWLLLAGIIGVFTLAAAGFDDTPEAVDRGFGLLLLGVLLLSPLGWLYYVWFAMGPVLALALRWRRAPGEPGPQGKSVLLGAGAAGLMWPLVATLLAQPWRLGTLFFGSVYFWSVLAMWLGLLVDRKPATKSLADAHAVADTASTEASAPA